MSAPRCVVCDDIGCEFCPRVGNLTVARPDFSEVDATSPFAEPVAGAGPRSGETLADTLDRQERENRETSLRPRPGETAEDTLARVVAAIRRQS